MFIFWIFCFDRCRWFVYILKYFECVCAKNLRSGHRANFVKFFLCIFFIFEFCGIYSPFNLLLRLLISETTITWLRLSNFYFKFRLFDQPNKHFFFFPPVICILWNLIISSSYKVVESINWEICDFLFDDSIKRKFLSL